LKLIFLVATRVVSVPGLCRREAWWKDAEILMLGHQLAVALRDRPGVHTRLTWPDRAWLALLAGTRPAHRLAAMRLIDLRAAAGAPTAAETVPRRTHLARPIGGTVRDDDLGSLQRAVLKPDGIAGLLRWLARRFGGHAVLVNLAGNLERAFPDCPFEIPHEAAGDIRRVIAGECSAASIRGPSWWARAARVGGLPGGRALLVTARAPLTPDDAALIAHAAVLLQLRCSADVLEQATGHIREAVLHLLMARQVTAARRVAGAMKPPLASMVRVYVAEGPHAARGTIADLCEIASHGTAWIIRCPVHRQHVIILAPVGDRLENDDEISRCLRAARASVAIGASDVVPLQDTAAGYEQAYHALAVARHRPDRRALFTEAGDLTAVLGHAARAWAQRELSPLLEYTPSRPRDPDGPQLCATLRSWLDFRAAAWRQLKIHRNTLADRIHRIETILDRDLSRLPDQAELHLALRLLSRTGGDTAGAAPGLSELLASPAAGTWAQMMLAPLTGRAGLPLLDTVRAWLAEDTRLDATAAALGISARGVHRRLVRAEQRLSRSLLGGPSARYDVLMALRIHDRMAAGR